MSDSNQKSQELIEQIREWQRQVSACSKSYKNKEIKEVLSKIIIPKAISKNILKEILLQASSIFSGLISVIFDTETIEVLNLVSEAILISVDYELASCSFAKIGFSLIRRNVDVIKVTTSVLHVFVENLTQSVKSKIKKLNANPMAQKLVVNFIKIISELQTSFHKELSGNAHIAELIHMDSLKSVKELEKLIADLSMAEEVVDTSFWESIFNRNDVSLEEYINLIQQIISKPMSIMTAMSTNIKSNICCQTLMALSKNFIIIEKNSEAYNRALSMIYDLITSSYLSNENFKFIEKFMMEAILSKNYCLGVNCLLIFIRYLQHLTNPKLINHYYKLLQVLDRSLLSTSAGLQQKRISFMFKIFCKAHRKTCTDNAIDDKQPNSNFTETFQLIKEEACDENYQKLIESLKNIDKLNNQGISDFCDLIELLEECDWYEVSPLVVQVLKSIKNVEKIENKMILLSKIQRSLDKDMPFTVKECILEILASCLPHVSSYNGLTSFVEISLKKLLRENYPLRRSWYNLNKDTSQQTGKYAIDEKLTCPENIIDTLSTVAATRKRPMSSN